MKQLTAIVISGILSAFSFKAMAQGEDGKNKKETEEIIIRKNGDKDITLTVEIKGDKVTVNGQPLSEFKDDGVTINNRKMIIRDRNSMEMLEELGNLDKMDFPSFTWPAEGSSKVVLGVVTEKSDNGVVITDVTEGSAADKAGLKEGDIILKFDGDKIADPQDLFDAVNKKKAKDEVKIDIKRDGKEKKIKAILGERKDVSFGMAMPNGQFKSYTIPRVRVAPGRTRTPATPVVPGFDLSDHLDFAYSFSGKPKLGLKIQDLEEGDGVKVLEVEENSNSAKAGMKPNDIITEIGGEKIKNTDDAREALMENDEKSSYKIKAKRNSNEMTFEIKVPKKLRTTNL